jgi:pimeloyl-ACP methyl ester carboxylesterase
MNARRWSTAIIGLLLVLLAVWQILAAARGLEITTLRTTYPPLEIVTHKGGAAGDRPLVLVAHGFAGSTVIMRGFALTLAHAGYDVVLWDFGGHGANPQPMASSTGGNTLLVDAEAALAEAQARGLGTSGQIAILGHSMGSGVALAFGQEHPETAATIAVSPTGQPVTPDLPRNLLLMAGSLEGRFVRSAEERLAEAGGDGGDAAAGTARELVVVPNVEHISILFSPTAHATAREWLDATFGVQAGTADYTDRRVLWYALGLLGTVLAAIGLAPLVARSLPEYLPARPVWWRLGALVGGALGATLVLWLLGRAGLELRSLFGLLVGGYLLVWFGVAGIMALLLLWITPSRPAASALVAGLLAFATLWLGMGLLGHVVWLPWLLIPRRLLLWPLGAVLLFPWFLAAGEVVRNTSFGGRLGWWLGYSAVLAGSMLLALSLSPELGFLILILPLFPVILLIHALITAPYRGSWPFALSGALFTSWLLLAVFPIV